MGRLKPSTTRSGATPGREEARVTQRQGVRYEKGGPAGANQGGAPRGGSRVEPSHQHDRVKKDRAKR